MNELQGVQTLFNKLEKRLEDTPLPLLIYLC